MEKSRVKLFGKTAETHKLRSPAREIAYVGLAIALIAVCAWISLPIGPIPFTLQTLAVAFAGGLLGWKRGGIAVLVYILMGLIGIPVFAGFKAGTATLFGATGGYIFGFLFLALIPAFFQRIRVKNQWGQTAVYYAGMLLGLAVCYFFGTVWFTVVYDCTLEYALTLCVIPYILPDLFKLALAALLVKRLEKVIK
jgi:biotin transport system substrate-specific component